MLFILPIKTSIRPWRTPYANYGLIAANIIIFVLSILPVDGSANFVHTFMLTPTRPHLWQFISYAFLHGSFGHILGNMFFLYLFGNNVNDKLGNIGYLCFYLAGAVFSVIGHVLIGGGNVLGASGAIAAVTGAYLVLFPQALVTVFFWLFYFIDTFQVSALYFIGFKLIFWDNMLERSMPNVAYEAHLFGYGFGILVMLSMLAAGLVGSSGLDLWSMIKKWNRRRSFRDVVSDGYDPSAGRARRQIKVKEVKKTAVQKQTQKKIQQLRGELSSRINQRNLSAAADLYLELIKIDCDQVPPRQYLLDIANQLASENKHAESAQAYEKFLTHYSSYEYVEQVELMLGILYSRYLNKPWLAVKHLTAAAQKLSDPSQAKMCQDELAGLQG